MPLVGVHVALDISTGGATEATSSQRAGKQRGGESGCWMGEEPLTSPNLGPPKGSFLEGTWDPLF